MDLDEARSYVRSNHRAVVAVLKPDGTPAMSPVAAAVDEAGRVVISTRQTAYKVRHLRRDPRVFVCVVPDAWYGQWVQLAGEAEILDLPEAMEPLVDYYRQVAGEHPDWDDYRAAMTREQRCLLRITLTRAGPDREG